MGSSSDVHSQRPEYQRENIDIALQAILNLLKEIDIDDYEYDPNNIKYAYIKEAGLYHRESDITEINIHYWFDTVTHIHELLHAFSSKNRHWWKSDNWFSYKFQEDNKTISWLSWFNEGFTDLLTLGITAKNYDIIMNFKEKYRKLMKKHYKLALKSGDKSSSIYIQWIHDSWWYPAYFHEIQLVKVLIDFIAYSRRRKKGIKFEKQKIWDDLVFSYFDGDRETLEELLQEADRSWKLYERVVYLKETTEDVKKTVAEIQDKIRKTFHSSYKIWDIPTTL